MRNRTIEVVLVLLAAALLFWGMARAVSRGEPAVKAWTSYAMVGLIVLGAVNIFVRLKAIASTVASACALFALLVVLAALLGAPQEIPNRVPAMLRSLFFFHYDRYRQLDADDVVTPDAGGWQVTEGSRDNPPLERTAAAGIPYLQSGVARGPPRPLNGNRSHSSVSRSSDSSQLGIGEVPTEFLGKPSTCRVMVQLKIGPSKPPLGNGSEVGHLVCSGDRD